MRRSVSLIFALAAPLAACGRYGLDDVVDELEPADTGSAESDAPVDLGVDSGSDVTLGPPPIPHGVDTRCGSGAWCFVHPSPTGTPINALWGLGSDMWFVGASGTLLRFDGDKWGGEIGKREGLFGTVSGSGPNDVWVGGVRVLLRYDGAAWKSYPTDRVIRDVRVRAPDDAWIVDGFDANSLLHWDGSGFERITGLDGTVSTAISTATDDAWITTTTGVYRRHAGTLERLSRFTSGFALWASGPKDVWISTGSEVVHGDGTSWSTLSTPTSASRFSGSGPNDVYIGEYPGKLHHWDGTAATPVTVPFAVQEAFSPATGDLWIRGAFNQIARWRGGAWWRPAGNDLLNDDVRPSELWGSTPADVWMAAYHAILHFDGTSWRVFETVPDFQLGSVSGTAADDVWIGGTEGAPAWRVAFLHWDGARWSRVAVTADGALLGVWAHRRDEAWAVVRTSPSLDTVVLRWDGTSWSEAHRSTLVGSPERIFGRGSNDIWIAGSNGALHWDGTDWKHEKPSIGPSDYVILGDVWGSASSGPIWFPMRTGWLFGIARYDAGAFTTAMLHVGSGDTKGLWGDDGPTRVWALGNDGIHRFDGTAWSRIATVGIGGRVRLWSGKAGDVWAVGSGDVPFIMRRLDP